MDILLRLTDNVLELLGASDVAGQFLNAAAVQVTLVDARSDAEIGGQTWPTALTYVPASNGDYRGLLGAGLAVTDAQRLTAKITFDGGPGLERYVELPVLVQTDQG